MNFFIERTGHGIWKAVKERRPFVPTHKVNDNVADKPEKDWSKEDKENVGHGLQEKNITTTALGLDEFL